MGNGQWVVGISAGLRKSCSKLQGRRIKVESDWTMEPAWGGGGQRAKGKKDPGPKRESESGSDTREQLETGQIKKKKASWVQSGAQYGRREAPTRTSGVTRIYQEYPETELCILLLQSPPVHQPTEPTTEDMYRSKHYGEYGSMKINCHPDSNLDVCPGWVLNPDDAAFDSFFRLMLV